MPHAPSPAAARRPARARRSHALLTALGGAALSLALPAGALSAAQPLGGPYAQDFAALSPTGTANPWADDATIPGWYANRTTYLAGTGTSTTGGLHSFGTGADRALGSLGSNSTGTVIHGARFVNDTAQTITELDVAYTGEQWRNGGNTSQHRLTVSYQVGATDLATGTWTPVPALTFTGPVASATAGALDGDLPANSAAVGARITGLSIAPGQEFWLRFEDVNDAGNDHGLAVDDLTVSRPTVTPGGITVTQSDGSTAVTEGGATDTYTIALTTVPAAPVTVTVTGDPQVSAVPATVELTDTAPATVTVSAVQDADVEGPHTGTIAHAVSSSDPAYAGLPAPSVTVAVTDDENVCDAPATPIGQVQGSGAAAATTGPVTVKGVVVGDYEGGSSPELRGFYVQDAGDGDPATSDAIFVFRGSAPDAVAPGDVVRVSGTAGEFQGQTQISGATVDDCGTGTLPAAEVTLPVPAPVAGVDHLERYEGMLVRLPQTLTVTESFQLGRFGQVVLSSGGRLFQPTHLVAPGGAAQTLLAANLRNRIILDDELQNQNRDPILFGRGGTPLTAANTLRIGDTATGVQGVMTFTWAGNAASGNAFRVRPVNALGGAVPAFAPANPRPAGPPSLGRATVRVASANVLNYFNTFSGCLFGVGGPAADCRGAENANEFDRQNAKILPELLGLDADVIALSEIENDGYGPGSAIAELVDRLNAATAPGTWAFIDADAAAGVNALGTDAIKVGIIYRPAAVTPVGTAATLTTGAFGLFDLTSGPAIGRNRPPLAQTFQSVRTGGRVTVVANHLKSKGSACTDNVAPVPSDPDTGDGQGNCNLTRTRAAQEMVAWLATGPTGVQDADVLITGDLNAYAQEDPVTAIRGAGYRDLIAGRIGADAYSFVFDGQSGYLDHALATPSLAGQVTGVGEWHVNADEPSVLDYQTNFKSANLQSVLFAPDAFRSSDHDPLLVGMDLLPSVDVADAAATEGEDLIFRVTLTAPAARTVLVRWRGADGTATAPRDYRPSPVGVAVIGRGETEAVIRIPTRRDAVTDPAETLTVSITPPGGYQGGRQVATGTITDAP